MDFLFKGLKNKFEIASVNDPPRKARQDHLGLKKPVLYIVYPPFICLLFISPKWQQATVLHESKPQIERGRLVNSKSLKTNVSKNTQMVNIQMGHLLQKKYVQGILVKRNRTRFRHLGTRFFYI